MAILFEDQSAPETDGEPHFISAIPLLCVERDGGLCIVKSFDASLALPYCQETKMIRYDKLLQARPTCQGCLRAAFAAWTVAL